MLQPRFARTMPAQLLGRRPRRRAHDRCRRRLPGNTSPPARRRRNPWVVDLRALGEVFPHPGEPRRRPMPRSRHHAASRIRTPADHVRRVPGGRRHGQRCAPDPIRRPPRCAFRARSTTGCPFVRLVHAPGSKESTRTLRFFVDDGASMMLATIRPRAGQRVMPEDARCTLYLGSGQPHPQSPASRSRWGSEASG